MSRNRLPPKTPEQIAADARRTTQAGARRLRDSDAKAAASGDWLVEWYGNSPGGRLIQDVAEGRFTVIVATETGTKQG